MVRANLAPRHPPPARARLLSNGTRCLDAACLTRPLRISRAQIQLSRALSCSCPAATGFVLGSRDPISVSSLYESPCMRALDDVLALEALTLTRERHGQPSTSHADGARAGGVNGSGVHGLPAVSRVVRLNGGECIVAEFERMDDEAVKSGREGLFPILWSTDPDGTECASD